MPVPAGSGSPSPPPSGPIVYDPDLSRVRLNVDVDDSIEWMIVERSTDGVRWTTVRGGGHLAVAGGAIKLDDYEFAADVLNTYRLSIPTILNANPYFETDASDWASPSGSIARSTAQAHQGSASLLLTPDGVATSARAESEHCPVTPGATYHASAWVRCTTARAVEMNVAFFTSDGTFLSISAAPFSVPAATWVRLQADHVAPANAGLGSVQVRLTGTPPATDLTYIDEAWFTGPGTTVVYTGSITPELDSIWLKDVARPYLNRAITVTDYSDVVRPSRTSTFTVIGRSVAVAVSDVRGGRQWTLEIRVAASTGGPAAAAMATGDQLTADTLDSILAAGDVMLIHTPADCAVPGGYVAIGDVTESRRSVRATRRYFSLPCTEVAAPGPDVVGATSTWQTVLNTYGSWADLLTDQPTWADLLELIGDPSEVITS